LVTSTFDKPYIDNIFEDYTERTFVQTANLVWHRYIEDRIVILLEGSYSFIIEDETPITMIRGVEYNIPKEVWHKII
jgi:hypothetical protein